jgi:hypothetical protein
MTTFVKTALSIMAGIRQSDENLYYLEFTFFIMPSAVILSGPILGVVMLSLLMLIIRKDCFQVKSNLLTVDNLVFHF